jgi:hypothetical protein
MAFRLVNRNRLLQPFKCMVCEKPPSGRVVDTGYANDNLPVSHRLRGRKYVCEGCAEKTGKALGMPTQTTYEALLQEKIDALNGLKRAEDRADRLSTALLQLATTGVTDEVAVEVEDSDPS